MANGTKNKRMEVPMFDGVNTLVGSNIAKKSELTFALNARSTKIGLIEKRSGTSIIGDALVATRNDDLMFFENDTNTGLYRISTVGGVTSVYYLNSSDVWVLVTGGGTSLGSGDFDHTIAENYLFLANQRNVNRYIKDDGDTVVTSSDRTGHLYNSPSANKINFYKDRLYVADFNVGSSRKKTSVMMSSMPMGIVSLISGDHSFEDIGASDTELSVTTSGDTAIYTYDGTGTDPEILTNFSVGDKVVITGTGFSSLNEGTFIITSVIANVFEVENSSATPELNRTIGTGSISIPTIEVTDTKYIYTTDTLDVYRGNIKIGTLSVTAKDETKITATMSFVAGYSSLYSSDELWAADTFGGDRIFRWAGNPGSGIDVKEYDTFKLTGGDNDRIKMMININDNMLLGNNNNLSIWNGSNLRSLDVGIGCVSDKGYGVSLGSLWFIHYTGIYKSQGSTPSLVSSKVESYIEGATKYGLENAAFGKKGMSVFFSIGTVTLYNDDGSIKETIDNVTLEYDIRKETWYVHNEISATCFATYPDTSDSKRLLYASQDTNFAIKEFLDGTNNDCGNDIYFRIDTDNFTLSKAFEKICYPSDAIIETERGNNLQVFVSMDNEPFYQIRGEAVKGCVVLKINDENNDEKGPARGRRLKLSFRDFTKNVCSISRVAVIYADTMEEEVIKRDY